MNKKITLLFLILLSFYLFCQRVSLSPEGKIFYFNSFETIADLAGWKGINIANFRDDVPEGGGKNSVYISGGCVVPHASWQSAGITKGGYFKLSCRGKNLMRGGGVVLKTSSDEQHSIYISVADSTWKLYRSSQKIFCPEGEKLIIEMNAGGFVASAMLVDLLKIERVD
ncbi:MAG TPA: hypothetical protein ENH29_07765 [Bacteroidetes bacterium]|nr:hypothetical protein [Bacteroidota bacterium]